MLMKYCVFYIKMSFQGPSMGIYGIFLLISSCGVEMYSRSVKRP